MPEKISQSPGTPSGATLNPKGIYQFTGVQNHAKTSVLDKRFSGSLEELWVQRAQFRLTEPVWREKSVLVGSIYNPQLGYISVNWLSGTRSQTHLQFIKEVTSKLR